MNLATALVNLGMQQMLGGDGKTAMASLAESLSVQRRADTARRLAWLLATWPEVLTDQWEAVVTLAEDAQRQVDGRQPLYMETTAAALARAGKHEQAIVMQKEAIDVARGAGLPQSRVDAMQGRLKLYEQGKAYLYKPQTPEQTQLDKSEDE